MQNYLSPSISTKTDDILLFMQGTGVTVSQTPTNASTVCSVTCLDNQIDDGITITIAWNDEAEANISGYTVAVNVDGTDYNLTNATTGCEVTESPSGTYTMSCTNAVLIGFSTCNCSATTITVDSITDEDSNILTVTDESCANIFTSSGC